MKSLIFLGQTQFATHEDRLFSRSRMFVFDEKEYLEDWGSTADVAIIEQ
jgi:hypothetical protein